MKHRYLVTGYSKKDGRMATNIYDDIEHVAELINYFEWPDPATAKQDSMPVKSAKDLDFDVQSRASHFSAEIIKTPKYCWSIFLLK